MDFFSIVFFLGLYYIRPQEWSGFAYQLQPVKVVMLLAIISMVLKNRERPIIRELFKTPHDWFVLLYLVWLVGSSPNVSGTFSAVYSHLLFYLVTVQALSNVERIQSYLNWWTVFIVAIAVLALAGEFRILDPMDSYGVTHGRMQGRLVLNTSIFNNPNALGHSVVPAIVMLYFQLFWKRPVFAKVAVIPVMFFPLYCIYLTLSKGAFVAGFATVISALTYRRPKAIQLLIFVCAFTMGWGAVKLLPRMQDLENASAEGGIQGRIAAFQYGFEVLKTRTAGVGYQLFVPAFQRVHGYPKGAHSAYVQIGSELGAPGLILFLGILYCCLRTLITTRTTDVKEERVRRILFVLLVSFMVSSWMVGFSYRATFFIMVAVIAAFHRQMLAKANLLQPEPVPEPEVVLAIGGVKTQLSRTASPKTGPQVKAEMTDNNPPKSFEEKEEELDRTHPGLRWNRFGWIDAVLITLMTIATIKLWRYFMLNI